VRLRSHPPGQPHRPPEWHDRRRRSLQRRPLAPERNHGGPVLRGNFPLRRLLPHHARRTRRRRFDPGEFPACHRAFHHRIPPRGRRSGHMARLRRLRRPRCHTWHPLARQPLQKQARRNIARPHPTDAPAIPLPTPRRRSVHFPARHLRRQPRRPPPHPHGRSIPAHPAQKTSPLPTAPCASFSIPRDFRRNSAETTGANGIFSFSDGNPAAPPRRPSASTTPAPAWAASAWK